MNRFAAALCAVVVSAAVATNATAVEKKNPKLIEAPKRSIMRLRPGATPDAVESNAAGSGRVVAGPARQLKLKHASGRAVDLTKLPQLPQFPAGQSQRPEHEPPVVNPAPYPAGSATAPLRAPNVVQAAAPAPAPLLNFDGLDAAHFAMGVPPDTNGDVGRTYYIQAINASAGVFRKSDGLRVASFSLNSLMGQGHFGNPCDNSNWGDPVVLYDTFEDRWIITDFAFNSSNGNILNPPGAYQCFAVSMNGDPVNGGWNFYSIETEGGMGDYPKFGIWPNGLYMSANMYDYRANGPYQNARVWALNKAQMYAGSPEVQVVAFDVAPGEFTLLPSNARLQAGTPPPGTPNYFATIWRYTNAVSVFKFDVDWSNAGAASFTGPATVSTTSSWTAPPDLIDALGGKSLDPIGIVAMMQNQYTNLAGSESLWLAHTVAGNTAQSGVRYYQLGVTGGSIAANAAQEYTHSPDATSRFIPSVAVDRAGDMAIGYTTSSAGTYPAIKYAGRLASDAPDSLPQTETTLIAGTGSQSFTSRWGDYSSMTLDTDGCTFWYTNEYYNTTGTNQFLTRIGAFRFPNCVRLGNGGTVSGKVTATAGGAPIAGATVSLGSRTTATNATGDWSFTLIPAGTYPLLGASAPGYLSTSATSISVADAHTTTINFTLDAAATSGCPADTSQADFEAGVPADTDVLTSPGDVTLLRGPVVDQHNASANAPSGFTATSWIAQTFTPSVSGALSRVDLELSCSTCGGVMPNIVVSIRAASGSRPLPTGNDLATVTMPEQPWVTWAYYSVHFPTPVNVVAGTPYAIVLHSTSTTGPGQYQAHCSCSPASNPYPAGQRDVSNDSGVTWGPDTSGGGPDLAFRTWIDDEYPLSGDYVSAVKDANAASGRSPFWNSLTWTASTPAGTAVRFQAAGSNSPYGPWNYVGSDGTSATYFQQGDQLWPLWGYRYLRYRAVLSTSDRGVTPVLSDVTTCFTDLDCSSVSAPAISAEASVCGLSSGHGASVTAPAGASSYLWTITNGSITSGATTPSVTWTAGATGSVTLKLVITYGNNCQTTSTTTVTNLSPSKPAITFNGTTQACAGSSITLTSSAASGNQWYRDGNPIPGATGSAWAATDTGSYTVVTTSNGCPSEASAPVALTFTTQPAAPTITPSGPTTFCQDGTLTLTSSSPTGNQWYYFGRVIPGATGQTFTLTPSDPQSYASGNYSVATTINSCSSAQSAVTIVTVHYPIKPTITAVGPPSACVGGSVTLKSSAASGNQWYVGGQPIANATGQTYVATTQGYYTVSAPDANGCTAVSDRFSVVFGTEPPAPAITTSGSTSICGGGHVTLYTSSGYSWQWYRDGVAIPNEIGISYTATTSGSYTVTESVSGACYSAQSAPVVVTGEAVLSVIDYTECGTQATLKSSDATGNQWYRDGVAVPGATSQTYVATVSGLYTVISTASGCPYASNAYPVKLAPAAPPSVTPNGPTTFCQGGSVVLTSSPGASYEWYRGNVVIATGSQTLYVTQPGDYSVTITNSGGCASDRSAPISVFVSPQPSTPTITAPSTLLCNRGGVVLTSSASSGNQWFVNGSSIPGATSSSYVTTQPGSYTVIQMTGGNCISAPSAPVLVQEASPKPSAAAYAGTRACDGSTVRLDTSASGLLQWYRNGALMPGETGSALFATQSGSYTVVATNNGCSSVPSDPIVVQITPRQPTPSITTPNGTTICDSNGVTLTSSSAFNNVWYVGNTPLSGGQSIVVTAPGTYYVYVAADSTTCDSLSSAPVTVTSGVLPKPVITPSSTMLCGRGATVTLTSTAAPSYQWYLDGAPLTAQTQSITVSTPGAYSVGVTNGVCQARSDAVTLQASAPDATITAPSALMVNVTGTASVSDAGAGAAYVWSSSGGVITGGQGTRSITFTSSAAGTTHITAVVTMPGGCSDTKGADVTITVPIVAPVVTSVAPSAGWVSGGNTVTITGSGFVAGATVSFGGVAATNVVVVSATTITAKTPAHVDGVVPVAVTNPDSGNDALADAFTYRTVLFDPNNDATVDPSDVFYLVNFLFTNGPAPKGSGGMVSGDANGDGAIDPADIFYVVNYLFSSGPAPSSRPRTVTESVADAPFAGSITLGAARLRGGQWSVPVVLTMEPGSRAPQALALHVRMNDTSGASIVRAGTHDALFETSRSTATTLSYLISVRDDAPLAGEVAEILVPNPRAAKSLVLDPTLTLLTDRGGMRKASAANGNLTLQSH